MTDKIIQLYWHKLKTYLETRGGSKNPTVTIKGALRNFRCFANFC